MRTRTRSSSATATLGRSHFAARARLSASEADSRVSYDEAPRIGARTWQRMSDNDDTLTPRAELTAEEFAQRLDSLGEANVTDVAIFSDLDRAKRVVLHRAWPGLALETRGRLVTLMNELGEENIEYNFSRALKVALRDADPAIRTQAIGGLWEDDGEDILAYLVEEGGHGRRPDRSRGSDPRARALRAIVGRGGAFAALVRAVARAAAGIGARAGFDRGAPPGARSAGRLHRRSRCDDRDRARLRVRR